MRQFKNTGSDGRNGDEYFPPRSLIRTIVKGEKYEIGARIHDGVAGMQVSCASRSSGSANLPIGGLKVAIQENGVPRLTTKDIESL